MLTKNHYKFTFQLDPNSDNSQLNKTRSCDHFSHLDALEFWPFMESKVKATGNGYPNAKILSVKQITYRERATSEASESSRPRACLSLTLNKKDRSAHDGQPVNT